MSAPPPLPPAPGRGRTWAEIAIVLALSLGESAVYSIVRIVERTTREVSLAEQTATINQTLSARPAFDLVFQLLGIVFAFAPVALVVFLCWRPTRPRLGELGIDARRPGPDIGWGALLAVAIGIPGLALYLAARAAGLNATLVPSALDEHWWTVPILVLSALRAAVVEEVIVVGYLFSRLRRVGWSPWAVITASALLRGSYHLYQGFGGFIGNVAMGFVFGWLYQRYGRTMPLMVAHWIIDIAAFVGWAWAAQTFPGLLAPIGLTTPAPTPTPTGSP